MIRTLLTFFLIHFLSALSITAQEAHPDLTTEVVQNDGVRVSVLGYHDFSETRPVSEMLIRTSKFRKQMQAIKDLQLNVITLDDFMQWKAGKKSIPDKSILITIDDGWKSVYTDAYPVLKEFGFPFTVYLYTDYLDVGGRSMTSAMIKEMMENGCSIGSHSVSHPSPRSVKSKFNEGQEAYETFLHKEFGDSKKKLMQKFSTPIHTYVYPGGYFSKNMFPIIDSYQYQYLFTCIPGKTKRSTPNRQIPRYIILGENKSDFIFKHATTFKASTLSRASAGAIFEKTAHPVTPASGEKITSRFPTITANLSSIQNIDPETVEMRIVGLGKIPAIYDTEKQTISWTINRALRLPACTVKVQWRLIGNNEKEQPLIWTFVVDREAAYLPQTSQ